MVGRFLSGGAPNNRSHGRRSSLSNTRLAGVNHGVACVDALQAIREICSLISQTLWRDTTFRRRSSTSPRRPTAVRGGMGGGCALLAHSQVLQHLLYKARLKVNALVQPGNAAVFSLPCSAYYCIARSWTSCIWDSTHPIPTFLTSVLTMNCSPGYGKPRTGKVQTASLSDWRTASTLGGP
jgi:hypothetical protein